MTLEAAETVPADAELYSKLLTVKEVAGLLRYSDRRVYQLVRKGELQAVGLPPGRKRLSKLLRFTRASLNEFLSQQNT